MPFSMPFSLPFAGLSLHFLLALFCAYHVVRTGQPLYWLVILFVFPMLGSLVYVFAIYLPSSRLQRSALHAVTAAASALDPQRAVREARSALEAAPTVQNQMRLAHALLEAGAAPEAATLYESCLKGPFASDLEIRFDAAVAFTECGRFSDALVQLQAIRADAPVFKIEAVALLVARCHAGSGQTQQARQEFEAALGQFGSFEALARYAIWALSIHDEATSARLLAEIDKNAVQWNSVARELNAPTMKQLKTARVQAKKDH